MKAIFQKNIYIILVTTIILLGILFRTIAYGYADTFEDDECRLLSAIFSTNWLGLFLPLEHVQSAPPLYLIFLKLLGYTFGFGEHVLKFIPYICSCISLLLFYKLCKKILDQKFSILCAMLLMAVNNKIIHFGYIIKQYSTDIMLCLLCVLLLPQINISKLSNTKLIGLALIFAILPFISLPSVFFIGAFILLNILNNFKNTNFYKKLCILISPLFCVLPFYYVFNLAPSKINFSTHFPGYWDNGFIEHNFSNIITFFTFHFKYDFFPNENTLLELILFFYGLYLLYKTKNAISKYILLVFSLIFIASYLHLYPWTLRVSLYSTPIIILLCSKPLDIINLKDWKSNILILSLLIFGFNGYNPKFLMDYFKESFYIKYSSKSLMQTLKNEYNKNSEAILCNEASNASFLFYSSLVNLNAEEAYEIPDTEFLKTLKSGQRYWFYIVKDFKNSPNQQDILKFIKSENILFEKYERDSFLILIEKK